jgi:hypothetical protein
LIRYPCPNCGTPQQARDSEAGGLAECQTCGEKVRVPLPRRAPPKGAATDAPADPAAAPPAPKPRGAAARFRIAAWAACAAATALTLVVMALGVISETSAASYVRQLSVIAGSAVCIISVYVLTRAVHHITEDLEHRGGR